MPLKTVRRMIALLLAIPLLLVILLGALLLWADDATRRGLEMVGTGVLDVNVTVADVDLSLIRHRLVLQNLVIDNPPGYRTDKLLTLDQGFMVVDLRTLNKKPLHIHHLLLEGMEVTVEHHDGATNLWRILDRIPKPYDPNYPKTRAMRIDLLEIRDVVVRTKLTPLPGEFDVLEFTLEPIRLERIGYNEEMDVAVLSSKIFLALSEAILKQIGGAAGNWF